MGQNPISKENLLERITTEFDYPLPRAESATKKLLDLQPQLKSEFEQWWHTGQLPTIEIEGYTVQRLMTEREMNPIAAILALDWLIREPEFAKESFQRRYDRILPKE
jgi:hypothetical protein